MVNAAKRKTRVDPAALKLSMKNVWMILANGEKLYLGLFAIVGGVACAAIVVLLRR